MATSSETPKEGAGPCSPARGVSFEDTVPWTSGAVAGSADVRGLDAAFGAASSGTGAVNTREEAKGVFDLHCDICIVTEGVTPPGFARPVTDGPTPLTWTEPTIARGVVDPNRMEPPTLAACPHTELNWSEDLRDPVACGDCLNVELGLCPRLSAAFDPAELIWSEGLRNPVGCAGDASACLNVELGLCPRLSAGFDPALSFRLRTRSAGGLLDGEKKLSLPRFKALPSLWVDAA